MAFVDESQSQAERDPHTYVLAAAVCDVSSVAAARAAIIGLQLRGQRKVHWRNEDDKRRQLIIETVASVPLRHVVVVRDGRPGERPERRRRHCLERLLYELDQLAVLTVTFESRGRKDDQRDRVMLDTLRARRVVAGALRIEHVQGPREAMLWVPDAVCGAIVRERLGEPVYVQTLQASVQLRLIVIEAN